MISGKTIFATLKHKYREIPAGTKLEVIIPNIDVLQKHTRLELNCGNCPLFKGAVFQIRVDAFLEAEAMIKSVEEGITLEEAQREIDLEKTAAFQSKGVQASGSSVQ